LQGKVAGGFAIFELKIQLLRALLPHREGFLILSPLSLFCLLLSFVITYPRRVTAALDMENQGYYFPWPLVQTLTRNKLPEPGGPVACLGSDIACWNICYLQRQPTLASFLNVWRDKSILTTRFKDGQLNVQEKMGATIHLVSERINPWISSSRRNFSSFLLFSPCHNF
jgi:hypothetical protein